MEEKHIALWVLGIIVVLAVIGLFILFNFEKTGAAYVSHQAYPAQDYEKTAFPYYRTTYGADIQQRTPAQIDWAWRRDPEHTYGAKMGRCAILATPEIQQVPPGYIMDANWNEMQYQFGKQNCIQSANALKGWCCKPN